MSSFSRAISFALMAVTLTLPLAACTGIRPVYSDAGLGAQRVHVVYAAPNNRLEQIIYNDLALRLGGQLAADALDLLGHVRAPAGPPLLEAAQDLLQGVDLGLERQWGTHGILSGNRSRLATANGDLRASENDEVWQSPASGA